MSSYGSKENVMPRNVNDEILVGCRYNNFFSLDDFFNFEFIAVEI